MSKVLFCFPPLDDGPAIKGGNTSEGIQDPEEVG